jgi:hypothetical protein
MEQRVRLARSHIRVALPAADHPRFVFEARCAISSPAWFDKPLLVEILADGDIMQGANIFDSQAGMRTPKPQSCRPYRNIRERTTG